jgi:hypothetical protein
LEKNIFILAKAAQVSDVAHGPLVPYIGVVLYFFNSL